MPGRFARARTGRVAGGRRRVLAIDNDPTILLVVHRILDSEYEVVGVTDAQNALTVLTGGPRFDAVLCDFLMPGLSGQEFYGKLLSSAPSIAPRLIFITGAASLPDTQLFLSSIPNAFLEKPFTRQALRDVVRRVVET
jgi:two-component system NtrC family sensor kinase